jgi:GTP-binding protein
MHAIVAIVGRPNVGKSTLFNRLLGSQSAIVSDSPGVTRDRHYRDLVLGGRLATLVDTGGFDPKDEDPLRQGIARGVNAAIAEATLVVCVLDALHPATAADHEAIALLRKARANVVYFANRADNPKHEHLATDLFRLGIDPLIVGSALHGRHTQELVAAITTRLPEATEEERRELEARARELDPEADEAAELLAEVPKRPVGLALLGRPNAGKSSLLNRLCGAERSLVDERPGTTRDPVDALVTFKGKRYRVVDTAGVRRKSRVQEEIEAASVMRAIAALGQAQTVVLLCDGNEGLAEQDCRLLSLAVDRGVPVVVGINKVDVLSTSERKERLSEARTALHFAPFAPIVELSVKSGTGIGKLMRAVDQVHAEFSQRVTTSDLNRFVREVIERTPPPTYRGRVPKIYYLTQVRTAPPLFVAMCSSPQAIGASYRRFLQNQLRAAFGLHSIPLPVRFRARRRREKAE